MAGERMSLADYRRQTTAAAKAHKYGAIAAFRCKACGGAMVETATACPACAAKGKPMRFHSRAEARRWDKLRQMEKAGLISGLVAQPRWALHAPGGHQIGHIVADFSYTDDGGLFVVEDVKAQDVTETGLSRWKMRHLEAEHGITVRIVTSEK